MRTIIAGTRTITDRELVIRAIIESGFNITTVLCGLAEGPDTFGLEWAKENNIPYELYPANWGRFRNGAGPQRNSLMIWKAEALIAIWDGKSSGTKDVIEKAYKKGIKVYVLKVE